MIVLPNSDISFAADVRSRAVAHPQRHPARSACCAAASRCCLRVDAAACAGRHRQNRLPLDYWQHTAVALMPAAFAATVAAAAGAAAAAAVVVGRKAAQAGGFGCVQAVAVEEKEEVR
jgi:hypothetical protein